MLSMTQSTNFSENGDRKLRLGAMKTSPPSVATSDSLVPGFSWLFGDDEPVPVKSSPMAWKWVAVVFFLGTGCATLPKADQDLIAAVEADNTKEVDRSLTAGARLDVQSTQYCDGLPP